MAGTQELRAEALDDGTVGLDLVGTRCQRIFSDDRHRTFSEGTSGWQRKPKADKREGAAAQQHP
jgi:hypothetical protein